MARNVALLEATMQQVLDHPETHDQASWDCGSSACFIGWAFRLAGQDINVVSGHTRFNDYIGASAELLGLSDIEVMVLSSPTNSVPMLELMVKDLVNGQELRGSYHYHQEAQHAQH